MNTRTISFAFMAAMAMSGCNDSPKSIALAPNQVTYRPTIAKPIPFVLPAGPATFGTKTAPSQHNAGKLHPEPYTHPKVWGIYLASSIYTNGSTDRNQRHIVDQHHLVTLSKFVRDNGLHDKVKVIWLQYDGAPATLNVLGKGDGNWNFMPFALRWSNTDKYFDYYVISPASRYGQPGHVRYDQWLTPYLLYSQGRDGEITRGFDEEQGSGDYKSKFWDKWNRHFFLVNPEGETVDAWVSVGANLLQTFPDQPIAALTHHLKLDPASLTYPKVNRHGVYHSEYKSPLEEGTIR